MNAGPWPVSASIVSELVCPETRQALTIQTLAEARDVIAGGAPLVPRSGAGSATVGATPTVLVRADGSGAYPVVNTIPVLLAPEMLTAPGQGHPVDLTDPMYAEAYEERQCYDDVALEATQDVRSSHAFGCVAAAATDAGDRGEFPSPRAVWLDAVYDCAAQWDTYRHIAPLRQKKVVQLGGTGIHAVKFLLAGAAEAWLVSPMIAEIRYGIAVAEAVGVANRLRYVAAVGEQLPLRSESVDVVFSGGSLHHMVTDLAFAETARVLRPGGKFAAFDPWQAPLYSIGTRVFGKREAGVFCRPLTKARVASLTASFSDGRTLQHGALSRYPLLALEKLGLRSSLATVWRLNRIDDALCSLVPGMRSMGSSVATLATK